MSDNTKVFITKYIGKHNFVIILVFCIIVILLITYDVIFNGLIPVMEYNDVIANNWVLVKDDKFETIYKGPKDYDKLVQAGIDKGVIDQYIIHKN